jgi:hypothetical protein
MRRRDHLLLLGLLLLLPAGCKKGEPEPGGAAAKQRGSDPWFVADVEAAVKAWLPAAAGGATWALDGKPKVFAKGKVHELLDGGADAYTDAGLERLLHARLKDGAGVFTAVEVMLMDMAGPDKAKAFLAKEKPSDGKPVALGDQAFASATKITFVKGRFFVEVSAMPQGNQKIAPIEAIAKAILATRGAVW